MQDVVRFVHNGTIHVAESTVSAPTVAKSPSASASEAIQDPPSQPQAKQYSRLKIAVGIIEALLFFLVSVGVLLLGISSWIESLAKEFSGNPYLALLAYAAIFGLGELILGLPLSYYSGFHIEHKYNLSNQSLLKWIWEGAKAMLISIPLAIPVLLSFYYCLLTFGGLWWLPVGTILFLFSIVLARIAPVLIFPLFYKFKPLEDSSLKEKILRLCKRLGVNVDGIFVFDMSKNTKKANAAFTGIGTSKRIILGDTLVANFTDEEIETVFAHELGHYKLRHIWSMLGVGTVSSFLGLYVTAQLYEASLLAFGFTSVDQLAALPLLMIWLGLYSLVTSPLSNVLSRANERAADRYAIRTTGNKEAFMNAMRKLAKINLADTAPHPLVEFLFYSHPSIEKRIQSVEQA